jgi:multimeric flavodoxin WrbA
MSETLKAVILYDSMSKGGSTESAINSIGMKLAEEGLYVEKAKCKANADYSFVRDFDIILLGAPVYYFVVASQLLGALVQGNLKKNLKRKKIALFLICGTPGTMAAVLYLPQLKINLVGNRILAEKIFSPAMLTTEDAIDDFVYDVLEEYERAMRSRTKLQWTEDAQELLETLPPFMQGGIRGLVEDFAEEYGYKTITREIVEQARSEQGK